MNKLKFNMQRVKNEQARLRDEALYEAYKEVLSSEAGISHSEAVRRALKAAQPRMWMPFYGVYRALLYIVKGSKRPPKNASRSSLIEEVRQKYQRLREKRAFCNSSLIFLTAFIIAEPSQGFYVSEGYANRIIWKIRKERRMVWKKKK